MEEMTNYEAMLESTKIIKNIADEAVKAGTKIMRDTNQNVAISMAQYIFDSIKEVLNSPVGDFSVADYLHEETLYVRHNANWGPNFKAQLRDNRLGILIYFTKDGYDIRKAEPEAIARFTRYWPEFKNKLDSAICTAIHKYNKSRGDEVSALAYLSRTLENFEV